MGVKHTNTDVKFGKTIRLGKNIDLDNAVAGEVEIGSLRDTGTFIERWSGTSWVIVELLNIVKITSADSPFSVPADTKVIEVTIDSTDVDINLATLASAKFELLIIRNDIGAGTAILDVIPNGSEKIKEPGTGTLLSNKIISGDGSSLSILPINATHWYIT